jgi:UDP-N-acetylglucosamine--N-acetylmuramyl-(pentapeptide) pyrophosphoryl-undecaprenol N-acetylglucosamine transferase
VRAKALITGGGTGGHVYPALSIIQQLIEQGEVGDNRQPPPSGYSESRGHEKEAPPGADLVYLGSTGGLERRVVPATGIECYFLPMAAPFTFRGGFLTPLAIARSLAILRRTRPRVVFGTGGYVTAGPAIAAWLLRVPLILFSGDIHAGKAIRRLAPLARKVAVSAPEGGEGLPDDKLVVTGYPLRPWFAAASRERGRAAYSIGADETVLLVFGGSLGARRINHALARCLETLLQTYHVIHLAGTDRLEEAKSAAADLSTLQRERYHLVPYLHDQDMADALAAADLALCRSGASVLGELPATSTPAVLVPLPARGVHQRENADYLERHGAGVLLEDEQLETRLGPLLSGLLSDPARLKEMSLASSSLATPDATERLAAMVEDMAG